MGSLPTLLLEFEQKLKSPGTSIVEFVEEAGEPVSDECLLELIGVFAEHQFKLGDFDWPDKIQDDFPQLSAKEIDEVLAVALSNFVDSFCPATSILGSLPAEHEQFLFLHEIGRGGTGVVYEAEDLKLGRQVAIKVPFANKCNIINEATTLCRLEHHNIAKVYQCGTLGHLSFIVLQLVQGESLKAYCRTPPPLDSVRAVKIIEQVLDAIIASHSRGIVHLDLTPSNILISDNRPIVVDFGLASSVFGIRKQLVGSPSYMAPELFEDKSCNSPILCDIFSLGVVLYELLTGAKPYDKEPPPPKHPPRRYSDYSDNHVDAELDRICFKALAIDPEKRFQTAKSFQTALDVWLLSNSNTGSSVLEFLTPTANTEQPQSNLAKFLSLMAIACGTVFASFAILWIFGFGSFPAAPASNNYQWDIECYRENVVDNDIVPLGTIGASDLVIRQDDFVKVSFRLDSAAFCYLISANPDGTIQFISQSVKKADELIFPQQDQMYFKLNDGIGQQAFLVIVTHEPISQWENWKLNKPPELAWDGSNPLSGVWQIKNKCLGCVQAGNLERGDEVRKKTNSPIRNLAYWLENETKGDIYAILFQVRL